MRTLINYIRSCFCTHDWELIIDEHYGTPIVPYVKKVYRCKKCGYSKTYTT
jgi:hypothetical protein